MAKKTVKPNIISFRLNDTHMVKLEDLADAHEDEMSPSELARSIVINNIKKRSVKKQVENNEQ